MSKTKKQNQLNGQVEWRRDRHAARLLLLFVMAAMFLLLLLEQPALAQDDEPIFPLAPPSDASAQDEVAPAATDAGKLTLRVSSPTSNGFVTTTDVINSDIVTYQITFQNDTGATVSGLRLETVLPTAGLDTIECACSVESITVKIINALGEEEERVIPRELTFPIANVANGASVTRTFTARVVGQAGGTNIENTALAFFDNNSQSAVSNKVVMSIVADVPNEPVVQANAVSATPNWFSDDKGGTLDLDWADVDKDGDLDLALASTLGTGVYINNGGQLQSIWVDPEARVTYGVRWLDVDLDGTPELVAIGSPDGEIAGRNYVFKYNPGTFQSPDRFTLLPNGEFETDNQLTRIQTGHFNDDNLPDLLLSVNAISAECPVFILFNEGANLFNGTPSCVSTAATAAIRTGDVNGDGLTDVALGIFPNQVRVVINASGVLSQTNPLNLLVDASNRFLPYDFAWGDFDGDGDLDLAAAFPLQREVRLYRNDVVGGVPNFNFMESIPTTVFQTPYAIELADLDRDGALDLAVGDAQPTIYWNTRNPATPFTTALRTVLTLTGERSETWAIRAVDQDGNGSLELSLANRNGPSMLLANYATSLAGDFTPIAGGGAGGSVAWGDANNDGFNDLLVGSPPDRNSSRIFLNTNGAFSSQDAQVYDIDQIGSHAVALGDLNAPGSGGSLDAIMLTPNGLSISYNGGAPTQYVIPGIAAATSRLVATGDMDGDGDLDIAVALNPGGVFIVENRLGESPATPRVFKVPNAPNDATAIDWGDFDRDHYLDLAVGTTTGLQVLVNNSDGTFTPLASTKIVATTGITCLQGRVQALAWADVNGDRWPDLAVGTSGRPGCILQNNSGTLRTVQQFSSSHTNISALDWGDWDNDGDLDLAIAHATGPVQVMANTNGRLFLLWQSTGTFSTQSVRWGDKDGDSDLDLAVARAGGDVGYFENRLVEPGHLLGASEASLLPNPSAYVYVARPGVTRNAYQYSTSEILAGPKQSTIPIRFRLFKPDGDESDPAQLYTILYDYSLNNGGSWLKATPAAGSQAVISDTLTREGKDYIFNWNAMADRAISSKALFRVSVINPSTGDAVQSAGGVGISPPFQTRATSCIWPADPGILVNNVEATPNRIFTAEEGEVFAEITFGARLAQGTGVMTFNWELDDGTQAKQGQRVTYELGNGKYTLTLTANGRPCPETRFASKTYNFTVNIPTVYLPLTMLSGGLASADATEAGGVDLAAIDAAQAEAMGVTVFDADAGGEALDDASAMAEAAGSVVAAAVTDPVADLDGVEEGDALTLSWRLATPWAVREVRIYRQAANSGGAAILVATLPAVQTSYAATQACGAVYTVVAVDNLGDEVAAQQEYRTLPCSEEGAE